MSFLELLTKLLYNSCMVVVIGSMSMALANLIITKISEESRRNSDFGLKKIGDLFNDLPKISKEIFKSLDDKTTENEWKAKYEELNNKYQENLRKEFAELDGLDEEDPLI